MVAVRSATPGDVDGVGKILAEVGWGPELADRCHYVRLAAVDEDDAVLVFIDGLFDLKRAAAAAPPGAQAWGS
jgi:hypothetical protein